MVGWAGETTLDVEYAHAIAPGANILLVETPVVGDRGRDRLPADRHGREVRDQPPPRRRDQPELQRDRADVPRKAIAEPLRGAYLDADRHHVTVLAASGDSGAADAGRRADLLRYPVTSWPASDPLVTGVGGTQLHLNANGHHTSPGHVWNDTYNVATNAVHLRQQRAEPAGRRRRQVRLFGRPAYQDGVRGGRQPRRARHLDERRVQRRGRHLQSSPGSAAGWYPACGTSEATPLFAGIVALADQVAGHPLGLINPALYQLSAAHARHRRRHLGQQHRVVHPGRPRATVTASGQAGLRPGLGRRHGQRRVLRAGAGPGGGPLVTACTT